MLANNPIQTAWMCSAVRLDGSESLEHYTGQKSSLTPDKTHTHHHGNQTNVIQMTGHQFHPSERSIGRGAYKAQRCMLPRIWCPEACYGECLPRL